MSASQRDRRFRAGSQSCGCGCASVLVVLAHVGAAPDGTTLDADALPAIIDGLRARGNSLVAIGDFIYGLS